MSGAAGKWKMYDFAKKYVGDGTHDMDATANWQCALFLSTSNANTLSVGTGVYGDLTNEHANANGYTTGGVALTGEVFTRSGGTVTFDANDPSWTASGGSIIARFAVIYANATLNGIVKPLLCVCLLDTTPADVTATTGNTFPITLDAAGIIAISGATSD
ncbi:MAG TPA: hypothetical protein VF910_00955 [Candidatus Bathyarchaeia archaeon]